MPMITVYPNGANGNPRFAYGTSTSWAACRSQATSDPVEYPTNSVVFQGEQAGATYIISRNGYVFDPSAIPSGSTITGVNFYVYSTGSGDSSETTNPSNGSLVAYTPSSDTAPTTSDYQSFGTTKLCDTDVTRTTFLGSSGYKTWALNAAGIAVFQAALDGSTKAKVGIRPSNDFSDATAPVARSYASGDFAAQTGTATDPYVEITYTEPITGTADVFLRDVPADANPKNVWIYTFEADAGGGVTGTCTTSQAQTIDATGSHTVAAVTSAATTSQAQTIAASGSHTIGAVTSTATTSQTQTIDAAGSHTIASVSGTGATSQAQTIASSGSFTGTGVDAIGETSQAQTISASGSHTLAAVSSSGSTSQAQTISASGTYAIAAVSGSGTTSQAQTVAASGSQTLGIDGVVTTSQAQALSASGTFTIQAVSGVVSTSQAQTISASGNAGGSIEPLAPTGGGIDHQIKRRKATLAEKPNQHLDQIIAKAFKTVFGELTDKKAPKTVQKQANKIVSEYTESYRPKYDEIDWVAFNQDLEAVQRLFALYQREVADARQIAENKRIFDIIENDNLEFLLMH
jgi:hypothetical protein